MLRRGAELVNAVRVMHGKGVEADGLRINWADLVSFKRTFTDKMPGRVESGLQKRGVDTLHGSARFVSTNSIEANDVLLE